jgi:hypothetical protein
MVFFIGAGATINYKLVTFKSVRISVWAAGANSLVAD